MGDTWLTGASALRGRGGHEDDDGGQHHHALRLTQAGDHGGLSSGKAHTCPERWRWKMGHRAGRQQSQGGSRACSTPGSGLPYQLRLRSRALIVEMGEQRRGKEDAAWKVCERAVIWVLALASLAE